MKPRLLNLLAALLDLLQTALLEARWHVYVAQREADQPRDPFERWATGEGRGALSALERGGTGRM